MPSSIKHRQLALLIVALVGVVFSARGGILYNEKSAGIIMQNWITPSSEIPARAYMWTWGFPGSPNLEPELWHFKVFLLANDTADLLLLWNLNQSVLFERNSTKIDESFDIPLPRTTESWRWDWLIRNPHDTGLKVLNLTVSHYPFGYPERQNGFIAISVGISMIAAATVAYVYLRKLDTRRVKPR